MPRLMLTDEFWSTLRKIMLEQGFYDKRHFRKTVEGILYRMRTGCPWRDLPRYFGKWNSVYQQFNRWFARDKLMSTFKLLANEPDLEWSFIDGSIVKAYQHSAGAAGGGDQGIGKSRGGLTTKIHMNVDSCGFPLHFKITGGEVHDSKTALELIEEMPVTEKGNENIDWYLYKCRHLVENIFARIKHFRAIATRYDKLKRNYLSMVALACGFVWLPM